MHRNGIGGKRQESSSSSHVRVHTCAGGGVGFWVFEGGPPPKEPFGLRLHVFRRFPGNARLGPELFFFSYYFIILFLFIVVINLFSLFSHEWGNTCEDMAGDFQGHVYGLQRVWCEGWNLE